MNKTFSEEGLYLHLTRTFVPTRLNIKNLEICNYSIPIAETRLSLTSAMDPSIKDDEISLNLSAASYMKGVASYYVGSLKLIEAFLAVNISCNSNVISRICIPRENDGFNLQHSRFLITSVSLYFTRLSLKTVSKSVFADIILAVCSFFVKILVNIVFCFNYPRQRLARALNPILLDLGARPLLESDEQDTL